MPTLVIKTNVSQTSDVLIKDMGFLVPASGGSVTLTDFNDLFDAQSSVNLPALATDDAFGAGSSTLILNNGTSDIAQSQVTTYLAYVSGVQGATGITGFTGILGRTGLAGSTGVSGETGLQGGTGVSGVTGLQGITGVYGLTGIFGLTGAGPQGATGVQGTTGLTGNTGTGVIGETGVQGNTGLTGQTGVAGLTGFHGLTGIAGTTGLTGATGVAGITGVYFITDSIATATANTTTTSTTDVLVNSMSITPASGTYACWFTGSCTGSTNSTITMNIYAGGSIQQASEVSFVRQSTVGAPFCCVARVTVNGSQAIEGRWRTTAGTATMTERTLYIQQVA